MDYFGHRYIFFKSLEKTNPELADQVKSYFSNINNLFSQKIQFNSNQESLTYMERYLHFIKNLAETERNNEISFLTNHLDKLKNDPCLKNSKIAKELIEILNNPKNFDYLKMIKILNELRNDIDQYKTDLKNIVQRMSDLNNKNLDKEIEEEVKRLEQIDQNNQKSRSELMKQAIRNIKHQKINSSQTASEKMAEEINRIFKEEIFYDPNILAVISNYIQTKGSAENLNKILENLAITYVKQKPSSNFISWLQQDFEKKIQEAESETYYSVFDTVKEYSIEEEIINGANKISEKFFDTFSIEQQEKIINLYKRENPHLEELYNNLINIIQKNNIKGKDLTASQKSSFSRVLKKSVEKRIEKEFQMKLEDIKKNRDKKNIIKKLTEYFPEHYSITVKPFQVAELIAKNTAIILNGIGSYNVPGQTINLKDDITFSWSFPPPDLTELYNNELQELQNTINNFMKNFLEEYNKESSKTTNVEIAAKIYKEQMEKLKKEYEKSINTLKENGQIDKIPLLKELMSNTFLGGISVKEYTYYDEKLGFKGGNLGANGLVINAIPNILKMYELGGISHIDQEVIIEALLNCGSAMIGPNESLINNLKDYLIGGAAMLMFDDGFATAEEFLKQMQQLFEGYAPKTIHLYQLQTHYVPASYVLQNIYENLSTIVTDISSEEKNIENNRLTSNKISSNLSISNPVNENSLTYIKGDKKLVWGAYSEYAQQNVHITFHFMAGILDMFEKLPEAFNIK